MYSGYLIHQAERQLSDAERREADRERGELAQALAPLFQWRLCQRARPAAGNQERPQPRLPRRTPAGRSVVVTATEAADC